MPSCADTAPPLHVNMEVLFGPVAILGPLNPAKRFSKEELVKTVDALEGAARAICSLDLGTAPLEFSDGEVKLPGEREEWQAMLELGRLTLAACIGTSADALRRMISTVLPERAEIFYRTVGEATEHLRQIIAWLAFMLDEDDEIEIQRSLIPVCGEGSRASAPSV